MDDVTLLLAAAAFLAGLVDAIVGGGGLIQLPALLIGLPAASPAQLLATNKLSSVAGTASAALTFHRRVGLHGATAWQLGGAAYVGAIGGAFVGLHIPKSTFTPIVLVMLVAVGAWTLFKPDLGSVSRPRVEGAALTVRAVLIGLLVGAYDGAMGPGTGSFFVIAMAAVLGMAFLDGSAHAKVANLMTNLGALTVFVPLGHVLWGIGLTMAGANLLGGYAGARLAVRLGSGFVRWVLIVVVTAFIIRLSGQLLGWW